MINPAKTYTVEEYIEILHRRKWYIIIPFLVIVIGAGIYSIFAPRQYKASTLVLVSPQRVPEAFIPSTVTSKIEERLQSIAQEVMSRTRLEQIISELRLYEKEQKRLSKEEVVELMQKDIKIELPSKKDEKGHFSISYIGRDPIMVTTVANRLASLFIEENLKLREQQAVGTTEFLANELNMAKTKLDEMETAVTQYKKRYMGQLPEQRETNIRILEQLQSQYQRVGESLRAAQDRKLFIQKQMTDLESPAVSMGMAGYGKEGRPSPGKSSYLDMASSPIAPGSGGSYESQKESLNRDLEELRTKYTEKHPDVIATKRRLADLEKKKDIYDIKKDPRYRELKNQLAMTDMEIKRLEGEERYLSRQINSYRGRIEQIPFREQDMAGLMREHQSTKDTYERLLKKSQEAQQAENLEKRQKGEQFRVIDPARVPEKPFSPDIPKILLISLLAGAGCGLGSAFLREQMDRSFHDAGDVEIALGLKVLATIPRIEEKVA
jgi:polysaccharide chain length determinant protein (PEP-CTERM system associated)